MTTTLIFDRKLRDAHRQIRDGACGVTLQLGPVEATVWASGIVMSSTSPAALVGYRDAAQSAGQNTEEWSYEADKDLPAEWYLRIQ